MIKEWICSLCWVMREAHEGDKTTKRGIIIAIQVTTVYGLVCWEQEHNQHKSHTQATSFFTGISETTSEFPPLLSVLSKFHPVFKICWDFKVLESFVNSSSPGLGWTATLTFMRNPAGEELSWWSVVWHASNVTNPAEQSRIKVRLNVFQAQTRL